MGENEEVVADDWVRRWRNLSGEEDTNKEKKRKERKQRRELLSRMFSLSLSRFACIDTF